MKSKYLLSNKNINFQQFMEKLSKIKWSDLYSIKLKILTLL